MLGKEKDQKKKKYSLHDHIGYHISLFVFLKVS